MIRTLVVADSGAVLSSMTATLRAVVTVDIVAYASGTAPLAAIVNATRPDLIVVDEMPYTGCAAVRIREAVTASPDAAVVGLTERIEGGWVPDALRAGAAAVVPSTIEPAALALVLREVVADRPRELDRAPERRAA